MFDHFIESSVASRGVFGASLLLHAIFLTLLTLGVLLSQPAAIYPVSRHVAVPLARPPTPEPQPIMHRTVRTLPARLASVVIPYVRRSPRAWDPPPAPAMQTSVAETPMLANPSPVVAPSRVIQMNHFAIPLAAVQNTPARGQVQLGGFLATTSGQASQRTAAARPGNFERARAEPAKAARGEVRAGGFSEVRTETAPLRLTPTVEPSYSGVEILFKPIPAYSEEARRLRIEGEVWLEVRFGHSGDMEVLEVVQGLGHGLDESAVQAARSIRFRPASRDGRPVDATGRVRITFQLAY